MKKIFFVDFDDSFSLNLISMFKDFGFEVELFHYSDLSTLIDLVDSSHIICFGPGPGHIKEYDDYNELIRSLYNKCGLCIGICLGHQILCSLVYSFEILRCERPYHGEKVRVTSKGVNSLGSISTVVQRYNSWTVSTESLGESHQAVLDESLELAWFFDSDKLLTMQFHPESIGTSCPEQFFQPLISF